jgi:hypothetical protein
MLSSSAPLLLPVDILLSACLHKYFRCFSGGSHRLIFSRCTARRWGSRYFSAALGCAASLSAAAALGSLHLLSAVWFTL